MASSLVHHLPVEHKILQLPSSSSRATRIPTTVLLLQLCHHFQEIRQLHAQFVTSGLIHRHHLNPGRLIESYVSVNQIYHALSVFNTLPSPDVFAYNTIIRGLTLSNRPYDSLLLYDKLLLTGLIPDNYSYTFVLKACSHFKSVSIGKQVHAQIIKDATSPDTHIHSSLIHMYANSGSIDSAERVLGEFSEENVVAKNSIIAGYFSQGLVQVARQVFENMTAKDTASWSAMITGYTKNGRYTEALIILREMMDSRVPLNESTLVSSLSACSHLGAFDLGRWIHAYINRIGAKVSVTLGTSLVDMYANCGCIESSYQVFRNMPQKDVVAWGAIISGFAIHGQAEKCFQLFDEMIACGTLPNEVIFVAILSACSHGGYVGLGNYYFNQLVFCYRIRPTVEHYGCMVDLLGRAGLLAEAEEFISSMPEEPNAVIWGALLGACRMHKDLRRGEWAFKQLVKLEPTSGDRYKLAAHLFVDMGEKERVDEIRKFVKDENLEMTCGSSFIEVDGVIHRFVVGDIDHIRSRDIYRMLEGIN